MAGRDIKVFTEPHDIDDCLTVGRLRKVLDQYDDDHYVAVDTGNAQYRFIPVYSVADNSDRLVLEL